MSGGGAQGAGASVPEQALVCDQAAERLDPSGFDPSRVAEAVSLVDASRLQPIIRKAADDFYDAIYSTVEEYLKDNLDFNITAHIGMLERENQRMRTELHEVDQIVGPPWLTPVERIKRIRELDSARSELVTLKYQIAFPASAMSAGTAETLQAAQGDSPPARCQRQTPKTLQFPRTSHATG